MIVDSDFYAIVLRYELHESMENLTEVLYLRIYEERNRIKTTPLYRFEKESVRGFWLHYVLSFSLRKEADKI